MTSRSFFSRLGRRPATAGLGCIVVAAGLVAGGAAAGSPPAAAAAAVRPDVTPMSVSSALVPPAARAFLDAHCVACHGDDDPKGGVRLDDLTGDFADPRQHARWVDAYDQVAAGTMPPKKKPRPPEPQTAAALAAVKQGLTAADVARRRAAGRVVLRRLNRVEYANSVRDLLGVETDLEDLLPEDASSMGFDNVADALGLSAVLMERYLEAADAALDDLFAANAKVPERGWDVAYGHVTANPNDYRWRQGVEVLPGGAFVIYNTAELASMCDRFKAPADGFYRFQVTAHAHRSGGKPLTASIVAGSFDSKNPKRRTVGMYDVPPAEPDATKPDAADQPVPAEQCRTIEFTEYLPKNGTFRVNAQRLGRRNLDTPEKIKAYDGPGVAVDRVRVEGPLGDGWPTAGYRRLFGDTDLSASTLADAERMLSAFASRAFRRPATPADVAPLVALVKEQLDAGQPFKAAIRAGVKGVLCSPSFLFLREVPGRLDAHAVAARLSYFLWSSCPDDELARAAADGSLAKPEVLRAQAERLLKDPKAERFVENFTGQWLGLRQLNFTTPDKKLYPEHDDVLQWSMGEETRGFVRRLLADDLSVANLIDSDWLMLNDRLAEHYGIPGVTGVDLRPVPLPPGTHRGGVLAQAAVLKVTANGTTTSPIVRGAWVQRNLLGRPPKPPPPNVPAVEPDVRGATTIRELLDKHRSTGACASCHVKMDPPGSALESFDAIGGWRETYRTIGGKGKATYLVIDGRKTPIGVGPKVDPADVLPDGRRFASFDEYKKLLLADRDQVARCLAEKLLVYGTGGGLDFADRPAVDAALARAKAKGLGLRTLVHEVVQSEVFLSK
jgi:mono/diheme cytochrome c family protein